MGGTIISLKNHKLSKFHNFIRTIPFFFFCPFFRPTSLQNGSLPETKFVHSLTPNEDEIDSLSFPTNLPKIASSPNKANTLQSRAVVKTIRPKDKKTKRPKDQKTKRPKDQKTKRPKD